MAATNVCSGRVKRRPRRRGRARERRGRPALSAVVCRPQGRPLIILDWDDTLLPTTFLTGLDVLGTDCPDPQTLERIEPDLDALAALVCLTLAQLKAIGDVVIVTNASEGWVEQTGELFTPAVLEVLEECKILSARSSFEPQGYEAHEWKQKCFLEQIEAHCLRGGDRTVLSIGDAAYERDAVFQAAPVHGCVAQSIKLLRAPTLEELVVQHELLHVQLEEWGKAAVDLCIAGAATDKGFGPDSDQAAADLSDWVPKWGTATAVVA